jgi:hypothetical protein
MNKSIHVICQNVKICKNNKIYSNNFDRFIMIIYNNLFQILNLIMRIECINILHIRKNIFK